MIQSIDIRYRVYGSDDAWITLPRLKPGGDITIPDVVRGDTYEIEVRNVDHTGRMSEPVTIVHEVAAAFREGAAALPVNAFANVPSTWDIDTDVAFSATDSTATITVTAGTLVVGGKAIQYGASSSTVSVTAGQPYVFYLYYDDPRARGGTLPLGVTASRIESMTGNGRVAITSISFTAPNPGDPPVTGGGNIGGRGGGNGAFDEVVA